MTQSRQGEGEVDCDKEKWSLLSKKCKVTGREAAEGQSGAKNIREKNPEHVGSP